MLGMNVVGGLSSGVNILDPLDAGIFVGRVGTLFSLRISVLKLYSVPSRVWTVSFLCA